jgi:hypothetical protein
MSGPRNRWALGSPALDRCQRRHRLIGAVLASGADATGVTGVVEALQLAGLGDDLALEPRDIRPVLELLKLTVELQGLDLGGELAKLGSDSYRPLRSAAAQPE